MLHNSINRIVSRTGAFKKRFVYEWEYADGKRKTALAAGGIIALLGATLPGLHAAPQVNSITMPDLETPVIAEPAQPPALSRYPETSSNPFVLTAAKAAEIEAAKVAPVIDEYTMMINRSVDAASETDSRIRTAFAAQQRAAAQAAEERILASLNCTRSADVAVADENAECASLRMGFNLNSDAPTSPIAILPTQAQPRSYYVEADYSAYGDYYVAYYRPMSAVILTDAQKAKIRDMGNQLLDQYEASGFRPGFFLNPSPYIPGRP